MKFLGKYWGTIGSILVCVGGFIDWPQVIAYSQSHKNTALGVIVSVFLTLYHARAPKDKVQNGSQS